jgi:hypothetical protein
MLIGYLITSLIFLLAGFAGAAFLFRRKYQNSVQIFIQYEQRLKQKEEELELRKKALQTIMYRTHHHGINPISKRIRGLCNLGLLASLRVFNFLEQLSKPNHQGFSKLAMEDNKEVLNSLREIEKQALTLETDTLDKVKEFEHLQ